VSRPRRARAVCALSLAGAMALPALARAQVAQPPAEQTSPAQPPPEPPSEAPAEPTPQVLEPLVITQRLPPLRVTVASELPDVTLPMTNDEARAHIVARRGTRILLGTLSSLGATAVGGGITALGVILPLTVCSFGCGGGNTIASISLGVTLGLGSLFAIPAAYVLGASRFGVRGSYGATFGGWWIGAAGSALLGTLGGFAASRSAVALVAVETVAATLPFVGMAVAFELSAEVEPAVRERRRAPQTASAWSAIPALALGPNGPGLSWTGTF
jgi:hypothetical protein